MKDNTLDIYLATSVDNYGPHKGDGAYAAVLAAGGHIKKISGKVTGATDYSALEAAALASLQALKKDKLRIVIHSSSKPFVSGFAKNLRAVKEAGLFSETTIYTMTFTLMKMHESVALHWLWDGSNPYYQEASKHASEVKRSA